MKRIMVSLLGALAVCLTPNFQFSTALAQGTAYTVLTITNPTPADGDWFGVSVAAVGPDRVLIGAPHDDTAATDAGAAYLFSTNGALLTAFTRPSPAATNWFGYSVAAVGTDRVLIGALLDATGADNAGAAYLFNTNGTLLTTFTNPTPVTNGEFSASVVAVGTDRVLIGAVLNNTGLTNAGAAYLFSTNGMLLTTFTNPTPAGFDFFGASVAASGTDRVLIGAPYDDTGATEAGSAYLFSTNGTLLTTFTNPTPTPFSYFGVSVATVGTDRVLIGATLNNTGMEDAGAVYLFSTEGTLLTTFTNPTPASGDLFGCSVVAMETDRVLIGAYGDDTSATDAGAAYLFSTNGALLTTFTNPTPTTSGWFGCSVVTMWGARVLIGAWHDNIGATNAGAVYLFSPVEQTPEEPNLIIRLTATNTVVVSWRSPSTSWTLQENTNGAASVNWSDAPGVIQDDGTTKTLIVDLPTGNRFYRLFKP